MICNVRGCLIKAKPTILYCRDTRPRVSEMQKQHKKCAMSAFFVLFLLVVAVTSGEVTLRNHNFLKKSYDFVVKVTNLYILCKNLVFKTGHWVRLVVYWIM